MGTLILLQRSISQPSLSLPFYSQSHSIVIYDPACDTYPFLQHLRLLSSRSAPVHNPHSFNSPPSTWPPKKISSITPMRSSEPMTQHLQPAQMAAQRRVPVEAGASACHYGLRFRTSFGGSASLYPSSNSRNRCSLPGQIRSR